MYNRSIAVIVNKDSKYYSDYKQYIQPYLDHFGFPYEEIEDGKIEECAVVMIAHKGVELPKSAVSQIENGVGLICFDGDALPFELKADCKCSEAAEITILNSGHYVTSLHCKEDIKKLYDTIHLSGVALNNSKTLVTANEKPLLQIYNDNGKKIVLWRSIEWASHRVLGPVHGMDDLFWRSVVWSAKKPFVMQGMPPFVGMRIDDVWGAWSEYNAENPVCWIDTVNKFGIKPWLGVFQDNADEITAKRIREYVDAGLATAFPHAFVGCEWTHSELPEHCAYFDHNNKKPYSDEVMAENAEKIKKWYSDNKIKISKYAAIHYYEMGTNAIKYILDFGCEFIGIHMQPDVPSGEGEWLKAGPYRKYESGVMNASRPVYYGDYLDVDNAPEYSGKLFNCITEIRDITGFEWHPITDIEETIKRGILHLIRAYESMVPGVLFTHESCWIQRLNPQIWKEALTRIMDNVSEFKPFMWTMDEICGYARAKHDIKIKGAEVTSNGIELHITGKNDRNTMCYVFTENEKNIEQKLVDIPKIKNDKTVIV